MRGRICIPFGTTGGWLWDEDEDGGCGYGSGFALDTAPTMMYRTSLAPIVVRCQCRRGSRLNSIVRQSPAYIRVLCKSLDPPRLTTHESDTDLTASPISD